MTPTQLDSFNLVKFELFAFVVAVYIATKLSDSTLVTVMLAAAVGFFVTFILQKQGYTYHHFPFRMMVIMILAIETQELFINPAYNARMDFVRRLLSTFALVILVSFNATIVRSWYSNTNLDSSEFAIVTKEIIRLVDRHAAGGSFLAINTHPYPGFPTALHTQARWAGSGDVNFHLPAIAHWRATGLTTEASQRAMEDARQLLIQDLQSKPGIIFVRTQPGMLGVAYEDFDSLAFYLEDPRIRRIWEDYREIEPMPWLRVFVREPSLSGSE